MFLLLAKVRMKTLSVIILLATLLFQVSSITAFGFNLALPLNLNLNLKEKYKAINYQINKEKNVKVSNSLKQSSIKSLKKGAAKPTLRRLDHTKTQAPVPYSPTPYGSKTQVPVPYSPTPYGSKAPTPSNEYYQTKPPTPSDEYYESKVPSPSDEYYNTQYPTISEPDFLLPPPREISDYERYTFFEPTYEYEYEDVNANEVIKKRSKRPEPFLNSPGGEYDLNKYLPPVEAWVDIYSAMYREAVILCTWGRNVEGDFDSLPNPEYKNGNIPQRSALIYPGQRFMFVKPGRYFFRMRAYEKNKLPSPEVQFAFEIVDFNINDETIVDIISPEIGSGLVFVRGVVFFTVNEANFQPGGFKESVIKALHIDEDLRYLLPRDIIIRDVSYDMIEFEVIAHATHQDLILDYLADPKFILRLAESMYSNHLVNATDACSAFLTMNIDGITTFNEPEPEIIVKKLPMYVYLIPIGVFILLLCCVILCYIRVRSREKILHHQKKQVKGQQKELDLKVNELNRREEELEAQLASIENQKQSLLSERNALDGEKINLEEQEVNEELRIAKMEHEELKSLDIDFANKLDQEIEQAEVEIVQNFHAARNNLSSSFPNSSGSTQNQEKEEALHQRLLARKHVAVKPVKAASSTSADSKSIANVNLISNLEHLCNKIEPQSVKAEVLALLGEFRPNQLDDSEYDNALYLIESEAVKKRIEKFQEVGLKRKSRLEELYQEAESSSVDTNEEEETTLNEDIERIEKEAEEKLNEEANALKQEMPTEEEFNFALEELKNKNKREREEKIRKMQQKKRNIEIRRNKRKLEEKKQAAEKRKAELKQKMVNVFQRITTVDNKVAKLKEDHNAARTALESKKDAERAKQREKLEERKRKIAARREST